MDFHTIHGKSLDRLKEIVSIDPETEDRLMLEHKPVPNNYPIETILL